MTGKAREREGGMAVAMIMVVLSALLLVGVLGMGLIMGNLRAAGAHRSAKSALFCAEAGLAAGKVFFSNNVGQWNSFLACASGVNCPSGYPLKGAASPDGAAAFSVSIVDNYDELPPQANDPSTDSDLTVILVSRCTDPDLPPRTLQEHITYQISQAPDYRAQAGFGMAHAGNQN